MSEPYPDTQHQPVPVPQEIHDLLLNMFVRQMGHKQEYDKIYRAKGLSTLDPSQYGNLSHPDVQAEIRSTFAFLVEELMEAINLLKNKPWRQDARETDPEMFYEEFADAWHFWIELMIIAGMGPDKVARYYFGKAEVNDERRASGY